MGGSARGLEEALQALESFNQMDAKLSELRGRNAPEPGRWAEQESWRLNGTAAAKGEGALIGKLAAVGSDADLDIVLADPLRVEGPRGVGGIELIPGRQLDRDRILLRPGIVEVDRELAGAGGEQR